MLPHSGNLIPKNSFLRSFWCFVSFFPSSEERSGAGQGHSTFWGSIWGCTGQTPVQPGGSRPGGPRGPAALDGIVRPARAQTQISRQLSFFHSSFYVMKLVTYSPQDKFYRVPDSVRAVSSQALSSQLSPQSVIQI